MCVSSSTGHPCINPYLAVPGQLNGPILLHQHPGDIRIPAKPAIVAMIMSKKNSGGRGQADPHGQDGAGSRRAAKKQYKEAAQKLLFGGRSYKDALAGMRTVGDTSGGSPEADGTVPLEDADGLSPEWSTVSAPRNDVAGPQISPPGVDDAELTLRDIFMAVTSCNQSITALSDEIKGVKAEISYVRHDMQKLRERTSTLEGRLSTVEDDIAPMQRDLKYNCHLTEQHAM